MGRTAQPKETKADIIDKLFREIDPETILAASLGAVAAAGGIIPPFTRLLMAFNEGIDKDIINIWSLTGPGATIGLWKALASVLAPSDSQDPREVAEAAVAASGALEAMIVFTAVKNPEIMKAVMDAAAKAGTGLGAVLTKL